MNRCGCIRICFRFKGIAVSCYASVLNSDYSGRIFFGKLRVVCNHDNQTVFCDLFEEVHDLYARLCIERARRLVCKKDLGVVYKGSCNSDSLHLAAGHLVRLLMCLLSESDLLQSLKGLLLAFSFRDAGDGKSQFDIG